MLIIVIILYIIVFLYHFIGVFFCNYYYYMCQQNVDWHIGRVLVNPVDLYNASYIPLPSELCMYLQCHWEHLLIAILRLEHRQKYNCLFTNQSITGALAPPWCWTVEAVLWKGNCMAFEKCCLLQCTSVLKFLFHNCENYILFLFFICYSQACRQAWYVMKYFFMCVTCPSGHPLYIFQHFIVDTVPKELFTPS